MRLTWKSTLGIGALAFACLGSVGYWYVFMQGAPQFDPPPIIAQGSGMTFQAKSFYSSAVKKNKPYGVILPPGYNDNPNQRYPVIFLLHGGHDDSRAWYDKYGIVPVLNDLYKQGKLPPSIIITPDGNDNRGSSPLFDPDYYDGPNGKIATLIASDLVKEIKSKYRTYDDPRLWALGGLSSGGWGAVNIGLRNTDKFCVLFSHLGYFTDGSGPTNSPQAVVQTLPKAKLPCVRIYFDAGTTDFDTMGDNQRFAQTLKSLGVPYSFNAFPGGHGVTGPDYGWNYIHKHSYDSLTYVGQQFKKALEKYNDKK